MTLSPQRGQLCTANPPEPGVSSSGVSQLGHKRTRSAGRIPESIGTPWPFIALSPIVYASRTLQAAKIGTSSVSGKPPPVTIAREPLSCGFDRREEATVQGVPFLRGAIVFAALAAVLTWPQAAHLATRAVEHQDVYFNMWRLAWVSHALASSADLFGGNIFYPEPRALTFSDALIVEALLASPLLWAGLPPVLVHNIILLGGIVLSGAGAFVLARHLTGSAGAGLVAGMVFAFAPYRFDHYMHLELQWAVWAPLALLSLDRAVTTAAWRWGLLTGLCAALQFLSSIYYGIFLATLLALVAALLLSARPPHWPRTLAALACGATLGAALCLPYAVPYMTTRQALGGRGLDEVATYSARPRDYLVATPANALYGDPVPHRTSRPERRLFPGTLAVLLALTALALRRPPVTVYVYLLALVAAFEMSLGVDSYAYGFLRTWIPAFDALRAPARLGLFVLLFLGALAAFGYAAIERALRPRWRPLLAAGACGLLALEFWTVPLRLVPYPNTPPPLYMWLAGQPRGVVAELPLPTRLPGHDARFTYMSTFHWMPTINGYSGFYPESYLGRLARLADFPGDGATRHLHGAGVAYVIVHPEAYPDGEGTRVVEALDASPSYLHLGTFDSGLGEARVYRLR